MNFLWDMVLRAKKQGWKEEELFFRQAEEYSPFYEQSFSCINETMIDTGKIELNLLYRFADIFQELLCEKDCELREREYEEFRQYLIDTMLHVLVYTDLRHGLTKREIYIKRLLREIKGGAYGSRTANSFSLLEADKQNRLAALLLIQMETGSSLLHFRKAIRIVCPDAILYQLKEERKKLLIYLSRKENQGKKQTLQLLQDLFLPIGFELRVFWKYHFGIIGVDVTMQMDEIALY